MKKQHLLLLFVVLITRSSIEATRLIHLRLHTNSAFIKRVPLIEIYANDNLFNASITGGGLLTPVTAEPSAHIPHNRHNHRHTVTPSYRHTVIPSYRQFSRHFGAYSEHNDGCEIGIFMH